MISDVSVQYDDEYCLPDRRKEPMYRVNIGIDLKKEPGTWYVFDYFDRDNDGMRRDGPYSRIEVFLL